MISLICNIANFKFQLQFANFVKIEGPFLDLLSTLTPKMAKMFVYSHICRSKKWTRYLGLRICTTFQKRRKWYEHILPSLAMGLSDRFFWRRFPTLGGRKCINCIVWCMQSLLFLSLREPFIWCWRPKLGGGKALCATFDVSISLHHASRHD